MKQTIAKITNNPVGAIAGGVAGYYAATKMVKTTKWWATALVTLVGVAGGAMVQATIKAKQSAPTAATTK